MTHDPWTRGFAAASTVILALILIWAIVGALTGPSMMERLNRIEQRIEFQTCLLLVPQSERADAAISSCVIDEPLE